MKENSEQCNKMESLDILAEDNMKKDMKITLIEMFVGLVNLILVVIPILVTKEKKAWHDMICGTRVVYGRL